MAKKSKKYFNNHYYRPLQESKNIKDLEPFVKAMYRKLEPFVEVLTYQVLSSSKFLLSKYVGMFLSHFDSNKLMGTFSG